MAEYLSSIFGTEKDKVNCSFYFKIGACRHGDRCSRLHIKPTFSQTIIIQNMYQNPANAPALPDGTPGCTLTDVELQQHFDDFCEDVFWELQDSYGPIEEMEVCDNLGDHLVGNVYVMFENEADAEKAVLALNNRWFAGRPLVAELSPVTDFREACCRQYEDEQCTRGGFCNFMHIKPISEELSMKLYGTRLPPSKERERQRGGHRGGGRGFGRGGGGFGRGGGRGGFRGGHDYNRGRDDFRGGGGPRGFRRDSQGDDRGGDRGGGYRDNRRY
eukprot:m.483121 g.483121  ORF g.483121 m.483121 type:complete len:273 (+) comp22790_c0_seq1:175-993(+)